VLRLFSPNFYDIVSRTRGLVVFDVVGAALDESCADRSAELDLVAHNGNRVMVWYTAHGRQIGNAFPRLEGLPVKGNQVAWPQVHIFRFADELVVEHWAVRDDKAMLDSVPA
jgi:hypothetical protein